jgi:serine protease inhibitor
MSRLSHLIAKSLSLFILSGLLTSCSSSAEGAKVPEQQSVVEMNADEKVLVQDNNDFAIDLYLKLREYPSNVFFSPYSISTALAMTYAGAKGPTRDEMAKVMHFTQEGDTLNETFSSLNSIISDGEQVRVANSLWLQTGDKFLPSFQSAIAKGYSASLHQVDFLRHADEARTAINSWVSHFTLGKIHDLLQQGDLDAMTRLVLVNAIHMKAPWESPFSPRDSQVLAFTNSSKKSVNVVMMEKTALMPYYKGEGFSAVELDYEREKNSGSQLALLVFLPDQPDGLADFEKLLSAERIENWLGAMKMTNVKLLLPKFKMNQSIQLVKILEEMGMALPFSHEADFSGMTGSKDLSIAKVIHESFINVDEYGTEAAAATAVSIHLTAIYHPEAPVEFRADHPFFFALVDKSTHSLLFLGSARDL